MRAYLGLIMSIVVSFGAFSQNSFTISGYIKDAKTEEDLVGAYVYDDISGAMVTANVYGFYSMTLPRDSVRISYSFVGYKGETEAFMLSENVERNVFLMSITELKEAIVEDTQTEEIQNKTQMSTIDINMEKVQNLPSLMGETDVLKTMQLLPGVQSGTEGASGIYVRGGGPDQNLILLDGVPVYNATHLFGFFSVFNADAIRNVKLVKGGFPARYGGRLSSVMDIRMKEGDMNELHGEGSIGIIAAKGTLEGPIVKGKSSFLISARRTYIDLLARPFIKSANRQNGSNNTGGYYFYDVNGKANYIINNRNRVFLSGYFGNDRAYLKVDDSFEVGSEEVDSELKWGNGVVSARWNHVFTPKLFANTTLTYSKYGFLTGIEVVSEYQNEKEEYSLKYDSGIEDWGAKIHFDYAVKPDLQIKFGTNYTYHTFIPGRNDFEVNESGYSLDTVFGSPKIYANELSAFAEAEWEISKRLKGNFGIHAASFFVENEDYFSIQPRVAMRYLLKDNISVKASYANMTQFLHLLSNSGIGLPTDLWVPVTKKVKPQISDQVAIGAAMTPKKGYEISLEGYYKWIQNIIEYKDGVSYQFSAEDWQGKVESGKAWSYGAELLLEKKTGKFTGWIGYTLSWAFREFENINFGEKFPFRYDRRHDVGLAFTYEMNENVDFGLVYVYGTGNAVTLPVARYASLGTLPSVSNNGSSGQGNSEVEYIESRNGYRMPSYHRVDIGVNLRKKTSWGERTWSIGIYNAYNRKNPFYLEFSKEYNESTSQVENQLTQYSLFPIIPSITYGFKF